MADGEQMGVVIEEIFNNTVHNYKAMRKKATVTLLASGWSTAAPYTQTVPIEGLTTEDNPILVKVIADEATPEQVKAYNKAFGMIDDGDTADGRQHLNATIRNPRLT